MSNIHGNTALSTSMSEGPYGRFNNDNDPSSVNSEPLSPKVDEKAIRQMVGLLFDVSKGLVGNLCLGYEMIDSETGEGKFAYQQFRVDKPGSCEDMIKVATDLAYRRHTNVFIPSCVTRPGTLGRGRREEVVACLYLAVDRDADTGKGQAFDLPPSMEIRTSSEPALNHQAFYIFDPDNRPTVDEARDLGRKMRRCTNADKATGGIPNLYRCPGTLNWPSKKKLKRGRPSEPQASFVTQEFGGYVDVSALKLVCEGVDAEEATTPLDDFEGDIAELVASLPEKVRALLQRHDKQGKRSEPAWAAINALVELGKSKVEIKAIILAFPAGVGARYIGEPESLDAEIHRAAHRHTSLQDWPDLNRFGRPYATFGNAWVGLNKLGAEFRFDEFRFRQIVTFVEREMELREVDDRGAILIRESFRRQHGFDPTKDFLKDAIQYLCAENPFHPVRDYLGSLTWDRIPRLDTWLVKYLQAPDNAYVRAVGKILLIAAVRRVLKPGAKFDTIAVLEGPQGTGKSTALKILASPEYFSDAEFLGLDAKAQIEALEGVWVQELGELSGLRKADVQKVKALASRCVDRARAAYAHFSERRARQNVFVGTTNDDEYLRDPTGNRRFLPIRTTKIDLTALERDRDQLWAEAAYWEAKDESIVLPEELWPYAAREQEQRMETDPWEDLFSDLGASVHLTNDQKLERVSSKGLLNLIDIPAGQQHSGHFKRISAIMKRNGWAGPKDMRMTFTRTADEKDPDTGKPKIITEKRSVKGYERAATEKTLRIFAEKAAKTQKRAAKSRKKQQNESDGDEA